MDSTAAPSSRPRDHPRIPLSGAVPVLAGRAREQAALREALAAARRGHGQLVLVGGEAGIGKTTLSRDLSREAADLGCRVLIGSCYDLTNTPPYGPWLDLFEDCRRDPELPAPPAAFAGGTIASVTDQAALFAEVRQFLAALTALAPALVILEDLHWADPASIDLLRSVGPHLRHWPILLLATYRGDELHRHHPLSRQFPALVRESDGQRVDLHRLDREALHALVGRRYRLARPEEDRLVAYLADHAEGNPFFTIELLRTLEEEGLVCREGEVWRLGELGRVLVPALLRQVIDGRIIRLGEETRKPLAMAAVIGQEVPLALWAAVAELDEDALLDVVERAVEAHLLEAEHDGARVHFVHALMREALYEGLLPPRRRSWHQRVGEALLANVNPEPDAVAFHLQQAGDARAWEWLIQAGDRAQRAYAWRTAAQRLCAAAELLGDVAGSAGTRGQIFFRRAHLIRFSDPSGAIDDCVKAVHFAAQAGDAGLAAEAHYARGLFLCYSDHFREGLAVMLEGIEAVEALHPEVAKRPDAFWGRYLVAFAGPVSPPSREDDLAAARLLRAGLDNRRSVSAWFLGLAGRLHEAAAVGERFLAVFALGPGATEAARYAAAFANHGLGIAYAALGRPDDARRAWEHGRSTFLQIGHHVLVAFSHFAELWDRVYPFAADQPASRRRYAAEAEAALERAGGALPPGLSPRIAWLSCYVLDGCWEEALAIVQDMSLPDNVCLRREVSGPHAALARHRGDPEVAWSLIRPYFPQGAATEPGDRMHQEGLFLQRLAADLCTEAGDLEEARAWLAAHDAWLAWSESVLGQADGRLAWARWHWAAGNPERARLTAREALGLAETPRQPLVVLGSHRLLGEIAAWTHQFTEAEDHLAIALQLAAACEAPFERALTLLVLAELRLAMGETGQAERLLEEVRQSCETLSAAPTLARAEALAARIAETRQTWINAYGLTQRELDVLHLIVAGRSNRAIADDLFISRDTARTHVANIFRKLDVSTRAEAVDYAHRHGLLSSSSPATPQGFLPST